MWAMLAMTALQMAPEIIKGFQQKKQTRSILDFKNKQEEIKSFDMQSQMMQRARSSIGSANAFLAGSGFSAGSARQIIPQQSMMNLNRDLMMQQHHLSFMKSMSDASKGPSGANIIGSAMFKHFGVPMISKGLDGMFGGGGGPSKADYSSAAGGEFMQGEFGKGYGSLSGMGGLF